MLKYILVTLICRWWRIVCNQIWPLWLHGLKAHAYVWMLMNLTAYLLVAVKGCCIRPFLSQLVEVCCLKYILFSILVFWLTQHCLGICIFVIWFVELDQSLLHLLGLVCCHLLCCVYYIQPLGCHFLTISMLFGLHLWQSRLVWMKEFIQCLYVQGKLPHFNILSLFIQ